MNVMPILATKAHNILEKLFHGWHTAITVISSKLQLAHIQERHQTVECFFLFAFYSSFAFIRSAQRL